MTKFKAGDRVRTLVNGCSALRGRVGTVAGNYFDRGWDVLMDDEPRKPPSEAGWYYHTDELELIVPTNNTVTLTVSSAGPSPLNCYRVADALDLLRVYEGYGDILRAYADAEDERFAKYGPVEE